jgi:ubiquinone/menaquinone biosynthesis C-methylase UbiE
MADDGQLPGDERYLHGYSAEHRAFLSGRTATREAAFFLPHLRPGMRLLDCGCGMGALTTSLAEWLAPGEVVGVDREPSQVEAARAWAAEKGVGNVRFEIGSVYALPYPAAAFDAVFAFTVLEHLRDPLRVLREMRRVLRPGGVAGIYDPDYGALLQEPSTPGLAELNRLMRRFSEEHGSPYYARHQRRYLLEAGFARSEGFAFAVGGGDPRSNAAAYQLVLKPTLEAMRPWILERGLGDDARVDALLAEARAWSERPDAFFALLQCAAVAWAP